MITNNDLGKFLKFEMKSHLQDDYFVYQKRTLARQYGPVVQQFAGWISKGGWLHFEPSLYVLGASITDESIHQTVSLGAVDPRKWHFPPDTILDKHLAEHLRQNLVSESPITFVFSIEDIDVEKGLRWFGETELHWAPSFFLAFFNIVRGAKDARKDLDYAMRIFQKNSRLSGNQPLRDWEVTLNSRFSTLEGRLLDPSCVVLCRTDAENHAQSLKLPPIIWPLNWPESVPPWPKENSKTWGDRVRGFLAC
jgi:hypothetical protein